jgi:hypothetical protein
MTAASDRDLSPALTRTARNAHRLHDVSRRGSSDE